MPETKISFLTYSHFKRRKNNTGDFKSLRKEQAMKNCEQITIGGRSVTLSNGKIIIEDSICKKITDFCTPLMSVDYNYEKDEFKESVVSYEIKDNTDSEIAEDIWYRIADWITSLSIPASAFQFC